MLHRLTNKWQYIKALYESGELGEDVNDTQEVFEDMLNRTLTREYLDVLKVALVGGTINDRDNGGTTDTMDHDDHSMDGSAHGVTRASQAAMTAEVISELGAKLLRNPVTCTPTVLTILRYLFLWIRLYCITYLHVKTIFTNRIETIILKPFPGNSDSLILFRLCQ